MQKRVLLVYFSITIDEKIAQQKMMIVSYQFSENLIAIKNKPLRRAAWASAVIASASSKIISLIPELKKNYE